MKKVLSILILATLFITSPLYALHSSATQDELLQIKKEMAGNYHSYGNKEADKISEQIRKNTYQILTSEKFLPHYLAYWRVSRMINSPGMKFSVAHKMLENQAQGLDMYDGLTQEELKITKLDGFFTLKDIFENWVAVRLEFIAQVAKANKSLNDDLMIILLDKQMEGFQSHVK